MLEKFRVNEGDIIKLSSINPDYNGEFKKNELKLKIKENIKIMNKLQQKLYAESKQSLLIVLQALDAGGKDSTIRKVFGRLNPQGCSVTSFKTPTALELSHDFLWRIHKKIPKKGMIKIFNRSHYEDVLIVKVHSWIDLKECERRYNYINQFEELLINNNTKILKFYLHISKDEQKKRFQERIDIKEKNWKFSIKDLNERKLWDKYINQFEEVFKNTSKKNAYWYIIPANNKVYRNFIISSIVRDTLEKINPQFPPSEDNLDKIVIE